MQQQHAISYVTTIRNRFANEPGALHPSSLPAYHRSLTPFLPRHENTHTFTETYRSFLKILHTYQKEQKGIKDVLEQVPDRALLTALLRLSSRLPHRTPSLATPWSRCRSSSPITRTC